MKLATNVRGIDPLSLGVGVLIGCFLVSLTYVTMYKSDMLSSSFLASQISWSTDAASTRHSVESFSGTRQPARESKPRCNSSSAGSDLCEENEFTGTLRISPSESDIIPREKTSGGTRKPDNKKEGIGRPCDAKSGRCQVVNGPPTLVHRLQTPVSSHSKKPDVEAQMRPLCEIGYRSDVCDIHGDIRIIGKDLSSVILVTPSRAARNESWQVKPYARKWDHGVMPRIKVVNVRSENDYVAAPQCTVGHTVPAIVFTTAGYVGNYFHAFTDVLVPLFQTARQFDGEVQFVISSCNFWWISKYKPYFDKLSRYEIIDYDKDARVHCYKHVIVGLRSDQDMMIDPSKSPMGYTMSDFMGFMRRTYSLDRDHALRISEAPGKKPRLLIISRSQTRRFVNVNKIVGMAKKVGFEVVVSEGGFDLANFSRVVNSCDVMLGVHGAGLTNFVFLPPDAVLIQVVPFGRLEWVASTYFAKPAGKTQLKYLEYTIGEDESTLTELFPRDDPVFRDPKSIHKLGWIKMGEIYLTKQNVRLDLKRFKPVLLEALRLLRE
ncbi:unnamed protein product [Musa banksii]